MPKKSEEEDEEVSVAITISVTISQPAKVKVTMAVNGETAEVTAKAVVVMNELKYP